jgi:hypothetical protein
VLLLLVGGALCVCVWGGDWLSNATFGRWHHTQVVSRLRNKFLLVLHGRKLIQEQYVLGRASKHAFLSRCIRELYTVVSTSLPFTNNMLRIPGLFCCG